MSHLGSKLGRTLPALALTEADENLSRRGRRIALAVCGLLGLLAYLRIYFGASFADEAFVVAVPYRYALGARPFVDEVHLAATGAGLVAYPLVAIYEAVIGTDGIMLFSRHLFLLFTASVAACVYVSLRTFLIDRWLCAASALLAFVYIPVDISLGYNALGNGFFTAGTFLGLASLHTRRRGFIVGAGFCHGLTFFCYPPLALAGAVFAASLYVLSNRSLAQVGLYGAAMAVPCVVWAALLLSTGLDNVLDVLDAATSLRGAGRDDTGLVRVVDITKDAAAGFVLAPIALLAVFVVMRWHQSRPRLALLALGLLPVVAIPARAVTFGSLEVSTHYVANLAVLALPLFYLLREEALSRTLFIGAWLPGFAAGAAASWTTYTGGGRQGIGFFAATLATVVLLGLTSRSLALRVPGSNAAAISLCVALLPVVAVIACQFNSAQHDAKPWKLNARVEAGPYAGLLTTSETKRMFSYLERDLRSLSTRCRLFSYYGFSAGFLVSRSKPMTNTAWIGAGEWFRPVQVPRLVEYWAGHGGHPDIALRVKRIPYYADAGHGQPQYPPGDPLDSLFMGASYLRVHTREWYDVYRRAGSACTLLPQSARRSDPAPPLVGVGFAPVGSKRLATERR